MWTFLDGMLVEKLHWNVARRTMNGFGYMLSKDLCMVHWCTDIRCIHVFRLAVVYSDISIILLHRKVLWYRRRCCIWKTSRSDCLFECTFLSRGGNLSGMSLKTNSLACIGVRMSLHVPCSRKLEGGAPRPLHNRRCSAWTMCAEFRRRHCGDIFQFVRSNKAASVCLHAWLREATALLRGGWTLWRNSVVRFPICFSVFVNSVADVGAVCR